MSADSFVYIGKTHLVCQDHALAGVTMDGTTTYAVVSDGCSSSKDSEFGSWALVRAAVSHLNIDGEITDVRDVLRRAHRMAVECGVSKNAMDATLMVATIKDGVIKVQVWGDGVIIMRRPDGYMMWHIEYKHGAPAYPSYLLDEDRAALYDAHTEKGAYTVTVYTRQDSNIESCMEEYTTTLGQPFDLTATADTYSMVGVSSDGMASFQKKDDRGALHPIPLPLVEPQIFGFKGPLTGEFVVRRMRRFQRDCLDWEWQHDDDLSVAVISTASKVTS